MTDVFQFILLNDPAPGVPDCNTQLSQGRLRAGHAQGSGGSVVEYKIPRIEYNSLFN